MSIEQMRKIVAEAYPGEKWKNKVKKMSDNQIITLYYKFLDKIIAR